MQRRQFETYLDKVFDWSARVAALPEGRQSPRHPWLKVFDSVFLGGGDPDPQRAPPGSRMRAGGLEAADWKAQRGCHGLRDAAPGPCLGLRPGR